MYIKLVNSLNGYSKFILKLKLKLLLKIFLSLLILLLLLLFLSLYFNNFNFLLINRILDLYVKNFGFKNIKWIVFEIDDESFIPNSDLSTVLDSPTNTLISTLPVDSTVNTGNTGKLIWFSLGLLTACIIFTLALGPIDLPLAHTRIDNVFEELSLANMELKLENLRLRYEVDRLSNHYETLKNGILNIID